MVCRKTLLTPCAFVVTATLALLLLAGGAGAAPTAEWSKMLKGGEYIQSVQQTTDGDYILVGYVKLGQDNTDALLIKTDANGNEQWRKTFGLTTGYRPYGEFLNMDYAYSVQQTKDGGFILAGSTDSFGEANFNFWLIKVDINGNEQWNKTFYKGCNEAARSVQQTSDGGYILVGGDGCIDVGGGKVWLVKTDSNGNEQWNKTFGNQENTSGATFIQRTSDGGYIIAGVTNYHEPASHALLIKTDANGNEQWSKTFGFGEPLSVQEIMDNGYILAGSSSGQAWLIKTDVTGSERWSKTFDTCCALSVQLTMDGGYIIAGAGSLTSDGTNDVWLIKTDVNGNEQWNNTSEINEFGIGTFVSYDARKTSDGGYILVGAKVNYGRDKVNDAWLIKVRKLDIDIKQPIKAVITDVPQPGSTAPDINKPAEKSAPGFEIIGAMLSVVILFLLKRKKT